LKLFKFIACLLFLTVLCASPVEAQIFKKKKKKTSVSGFTLQEAPSEEDRKKAMEKQLVNPVRQFLNGFNFHISKSLGYFTYRSPLTDVSVLRDLDTEALFIVPIGEEAAINTPVNAFSNWFTDLSSTQVDRINPNSQIVRTDTVDFVYANSGRANPWNFRLDYGVKKIDKAHKQRTGEKRYLDQDLFRIGIGASFGSFKFREDQHSQEIDPVLGNYPVPSKTISNTKLFGSLSYNVYSLGYVDIFADINGGVWSSKTSAINERFATYDPFFNVGIMFQTTWTKYFKGYIRPSFEMRSYSLANEYIDVTHNFTTFSIDLGLIIKYPTYPRNKYKADKVQMEHVFNGKIYRGRPFYRKQNPRTGQRRNSKRGDAFDFPVKKN